MSPELLHILQHSLGCDQYGQSATPLREEGDGCHGYYRNRFITGQAGPDGLLCQQLVTQGLMIDHGAQIIAGGMHCYAVTIDGVRAMKAASPAPPKVSRSKARYRAFRAEDSGMRFGEWLKCQKNRRRSYGRAFAH